MWPERGLCISLGFSLLVSKMGITVATSQSGCDNFPRCSVRMAPGRCSPHHVSVVCSLAPALKFSKGPDRHHEYRCGGDNRDHSHERMEDQVSFNKRKWVPGPEHGQVL